MTTPGRADPAIYPQLRKRALELRLTGYPPDTIHAVLMDWHVGGGTATVLAAADGTASIYLSSGGGFIGGSQSSTEILEAALEAVRVAETNRGTASPTQTTWLPPSGSVFFYLLTAQGLLLASAREASLRDGTSPNARLGNAMQRIVTEYRYWDEQRRSKIS